MATMIRSGLHQGSLSHRFSSKFRIAVAKVFDDADLRITFVSGEPPITG